MSTITLTKDSHADRGKYRVDYDVTRKILGDGAAAPVPALVRPPRRLRSAVAIVGAGFGGIVSAITCQEKFGDNDFLIIEKYPKFGGTWIANTYPGVACDIPSIWYLLSSELATNWSRSQSYGYEIAEYIDRVVEKHHLKEKALLGHSVDQATWIEADGEWELSIHDVDTGDTVIHRLKILINCLGGLVHPRHPHYPGLYDKFKGEYVHLAMWRDVDLKGKRVVVVGNGCLACQLVPALLHDGYDVELVTQVARSKHHIMPPLPKALQYAYNLVLRVWLFQWLLRVLVASMFEYRFPMFKGDGWWSRFVRWRLTRELINYMKKHTPKKYWDSVIPDFKIGCKRLIIDHSYLDCLSHPRMEFIGDNISHFDEHGLILKLGRYVPADVVVACTGYDIAKLVKMIDVVGRNGTTLESLWGGSKGRICAYETTMVKDMPNMFLMAGPNSASGHALVVLGIEYVSTFVTKVARPVIDGTYKLVAVTLEAYYRWFDECQRELKRAVYGTQFGGCVLWYSDMDYNYTTYPYSQLWYWWNMSHPRKRDLDYRK